MMDDCSSTSLVGADSTVGGSAAGVADGSAAGDYAAGGALTFGPLYSFCTMLHFQARNAELAGVAWIRNTDHL